MSSATKSTTVEPTTTFVGADLVMAPDAVPVSAEVKPCIEVNGQRWVAILDRLCQRLRKGMNAAGIDNGDGDGSDTRNKAFKPRACWIRNKTAP